MFNGFSGHSSFQCPGSSQIAQFPLSLDELLRRPFELPTLDLRLELRRLNSFFPLFLNREEERE